MRANHERFMRDCLRLAEKGRGMVSPNPMVGAVLVRHGRIIARGWHERFGHPHAEANCLRKARGDLSTATLYVSMEPCSHIGKTPPCADMIVVSGIRRVVLAMQDPNPRVSGRGVARLRGAGIKVTVGVLEQDARELNRVFIHHIVRRRPYVHLKIAQSLDGIIASPHTRGRWISSAESRRRVHAIRARSDAILVGAGTVRADNPRLTVRHGAVADPTVVILSGRRRVPEHARVFKSGRRVLLITQEGNERAAMIRRLESRGVTIVRAPGRRGRLALRTVLRELYRHNIGSLLVEGGGDVFGQFLREDLVDELTLFLAPAVLGGGLSSFGTWKGAPQHIPWLFGQPGDIGVSGRDLVVHARRRED